MRESRLAGSLKHPSVVTVHDYFVHDGAPFIAMEYVERGSLRPRMGTLTLPQIAGVLEGVLAGLAHAHARGVVHRDLKPENLMVTGDGGIKIADFGIAKALDPSESGFVTADRDDRGDARVHRSRASDGPGRRPVDRPLLDRAIAYELLTGLVPFHDTTKPMAILLRHVNDPVPPVRSLRPDVDARLAAWVELLLLAKGAGERPSSAREAWEALEEIVIDVLGPMWRRDAPVAARGIRTRVSREAGADVEVRLTRDADRLSVAVSTRAGAFTSVSLGRPSTGAIEIGLRKIARPATGRAAALLLLDAWRTGDRAGALSVAERDVVAQLLERQFPEPVPKLQDCGPVVTDQIECGFQYGFSGQHFGMKTQKFGGFYRVIELAFG